MTRPILRDVPPFRAALLILAMCAVGSGIHKAATSGYLLAFWRGETTGAAEWLGWVGLVLLGVAIAGAIGALLHWLTDLVEVDDPSIFCADELRDPTKEQA